MKQQSPLQSLISSYQFAQWGIRFPALTITTITRPDLGYRLVDPLVLMATFGLFAVVTILATPGNEAARPNDLLAFFAVGFACGIVQRIRRWWELNRGVTRHSYYIGTSRLEFRWLPNALRSHRRVARLLEPAVCAGIGFALFPYSRALGVWLIFASFCLRGFEDQVFWRERNRDLDLMDNIIAAQEQTRVLEQHEQPNPKHQGSPGIPAGIGEDIEGHIIISVKQRKTNTNKNIIDI